MEGTTDDAVARRICAHLGLPCGTTYGSKGKEHLLTKLPAYNVAARLRPWFALVDLDTWQECVPAFVSGKLAESSPGMRFRVAVRAIEAWLLADAVRLAEFLAIPLARLPDDPDAVSNPKQVMVNLARRSRSRTIRLEMTPKEGTGAMVGPLYSARLREFATNVWSPDQAAQRSQSLDRCLRALATLRHFEP